MFKSDVMKDNSIMRKKQWGLYLCHSVLFLSILIYLFVHITYVFRPRWDEKRCLMGFYSEQINSLDVVMIGTSSLRSSIIPTRIFEKHGITSYSIVTSSQRPMAIPYLIKEAAKRQHGALYLIDLGGCIYPKEYWLMRGELSVRTVTDMLKYSRNRFACILDDNMVGSEKTSYLFDIVKYHENWEEPLDFDAWNYDVHNPYKGFLPLADIHLFQPTYSSKDTSEVEKVWDLESINEIVATIEKEQLQAAFILPYRGSFNNNDCEALKEYIEGIGYKFLSFNEEMESKIDISDFYDIGHLNCNGALKTTDFLGEWLLNQDLQLAGKTVNRGEWSKDALIVNETIDAAAAKLRDKETFIFETGYLTQESLIEATCNTFSSVYDLEYAWYLEQKGLNEYVNVRTDWYTSNNVFQQDMSELNAGDYRIVAFARAVNDNSVKKSEVVVSYRWDPATGITIAENS